MFPFGTVLSTPSKLIQNTKTNISDQCFEGVKMIFTFNVTNRNWPNTKIASVLKWSFNDVAILRFRTQYNQWEGWVINLCNHHETHLKLLQSVSVWNSFNHIQNTKRNISDQCFEGLKRIFTFHVVAFLSFEYAIPRCF